MNSTATVKEENIKLQLTRVFDAPRELVFKAWTARSNSKRGSVRRRATEEWCNR